eukprot:CAMPEP_0176070350 /NCGR_PEP_ID=MMETSP0120_2-20121206/35130_1 /TAXON_ID=160619 /ORGANISM="Kryptoperidinium foliaceum, Strain CCMP 1326" /LENGTH=284 /DNA_ID=CAMNT_0017403993 /DNA_START=63 /DNA_END=915 /DNA_ORIENTATION=+
MKDGRNLMSAPACSRTLCPSRQAAEVNPQLLHPGLHLPGPVRAHCYDEHTRRLQDEPQQEQRHVCFRNLAFPAQVLQAVTDGHRCEHRDAKVEDAPTTAKEGAEAEDAHGQERLRDDESADPHLERLLPAMVLPLREVPIVLHALHEVPDQQKTGHRCATGTIDEIRPLQAPRQDGMAAFSVCDSRVLIRSPPAVLRNGAPSLNSQLGAPLWGGGARGCGGQVEPVQASGGGRPFGEPKSARSSSSLNSSGTSRREASSRASPAHTGPPKESIEQSSTNWRVRR